MDNTWAAGLLFKPLAHGVDISRPGADQVCRRPLRRVHGLGRRRRRRRWRDALDQAVVDFGWSVSPDDAYQMLRGLRTLPTRLARHRQSALAGRRLAARTSRRCAQVLLPRPARRAGPRPVEARLHRRGRPVRRSCCSRRSHGRQWMRFLDALTLFGLGFSWGGFESLALDCDPQFDVRSRAADFAGPLVRLNIGLEDPDDLIADLDQRLGGPAQPEPSLATPAGLEPATVRLEGGCSIRLSYGVGGDAAQWVQGFLRLKAKLSA